MLRALNGELRTVIRLPMMFESRACVTELSLWAKSGIVGWKIDRKRLAVGRLAGDPQI